MLGKCIFNKKSIAEEMAEFEPSYTAGAVKNSLAVPKIIKNKVTLNDLEIALFLCTKRNENICPHEKLYINIYSKVIHNH